MGLYKNIGETDLKFPGHRPYGRTEQFRAQLSAEQERLLVAGGSIQVIEPSEPPVDVAPAELPVVRGPLSAGDDATPDVEKPTMQLPRMFGPGDNPTDRPEMAPVRGPLGAGETPDGQTVAAVVDRPPSAPLPTKTPVESVTGARRSRAKSAAPVDVGDN